MGRQPGLHATCHHVDALPPRRCEADVSSLPVTNRFWKKLPYDDPELAHL